MAVIACLLIGNETWILQEKSIRSIRDAHPNQDIILYYALDNNRDSILETLGHLKVETVDIGNPGLLKIMSAATYSEYNTLEFNIKTSFKWLSILGAMSSRLDDVIFIDADIAIVSPLPLSSFNEIWKYYDIFVQDEGNQVFPKHPCTGFIGFKCCEANVTLLDRLHKEQCSAIVSGESQHDQTTFYQYISQDLECYKKIYFMPQILFPVGYMAPIYSRFDRNQKIKLHGHGDPFIFHANWAVGIEAKSALMDAMLAVKPLEMEEDCPYPINYRIGKFNLALPSDHLLPFYQSSHPQYDQFLPHLARFLPDNSAVIDVGANCGDTLASMASQNSRIKYICIEADQDFFSLLQSNILLIKNSEPSLMVEAINEFIGRDLGNARLEGSGGTKRAVLSNDEAPAMKPKPLDQVISDSSSNAIPISLIKIDTDGWDYDVINSAMTVIKAYSPLIYFECQYFDDHQFHGFIEVMDTLKKLGYSNWYVFDNFGGLMLETTDVASIQFLARYIKEQNSGSTTRTIFYMDILAVANAYKETAKAAIRGFTGDDQGIGIDGQ